jgi:NAD(P)-dependent dehydrogenase (short-subunit alcohol dehydrogenase family)
MTSAASFDLSDRVALVKPIAEPDEIKRLAVLLASSASRFMARVTIAVDGGATAA